MAKSRIENVHGVVPLSSSRRYFQPLYSYDLYFNWLYRIPILIIVQHKTPLQRLLLSGVLPAQKQQELIEVAQALDPFRLFQQLEQLQQAVFRCAASCSPFVSSIPSVPIHVFSVESCTTGTLQASRSVPDPTAGLHTLYREQERRNRVLGWRHTHNDPFEGEWEQITRLFDCQSRTEQRRHFPGTAASLPRTLSTVANPHLTARNAQDPSSPAGNL